MDTKPTIPFFSLDRQLTELKDEIMEALQNVVVSRVFTDHEHVKRFESEFAAFNGSKHMIGVGNGTEALHLAMEAMGIGPGDEVIVPANSFIATAMAVSHTGAKPVFADCDPHTWNISAKSIEDKLSPFTRGVIGTHMYGLPFDVDAVRTVCKDNGLWLVEDCAQAHGASYKGEYTGNLADIGCFSFYPTKNLGSLGEAGGITTDNKRLYEKMFAGRNYGSSEKYHFDTVGHNYKMTEFQAAVLSVKLKYLKANNYRRASIAEKYKKGIVNNAIQLQHIPKDHISAHYLFVVVVTDRARFIEHMVQSGIQCGIHYPVPCHLQKAYISHGLSAGVLPHAEHLAAHCVSLPMFPELTDEEAERVIDAVNAY